MLIEARRRLRSKYRTLANKYTWNRLGNVRMFGAPIYVHWSAYAVAGLLGLIFVTNPLMGLLVVFSYLGIIVVHELGHAVVANLWGYEVLTIDVSAIHGALRSRSAPI